MPVLRRLGYTFAILLTGTLFAGVSRADESFKPGDKVEVRFADGTVQICRFSHLSAQGAMTAPRRDASSDFSCQDSNGQTILSKLGALPSWGALRLSSDGKVSTPAIESVTRNRQIYYKASPGLSASGNPRSDLTTEGAALEAMTASFFGTPDSADPNSRSRWSPEFQRVYDRVHEAALAREKQIDSALGSTQTVNVKFVGGATTTCRRGVNSNRPRTFERVTKILPCEFFSCDPITIDGKKYAPLLYQPSMAGSTIIPNATLLSDEGSAPTLIAQSVTSAATGENLFLNHIPNGIPAGPPIDFSGLPKGFKLDPLFESTLKDPTFKPARDFLEGQCASPEVLDRLHRESDWIGAQKKNFDQLQLVVLVNGVESDLDSVLIDRSLLSPDSCHLSGDTYLAHQAQQRYHGWTEPAPSGQQEITPSEAERLFHELASMSDIPYDYDEDGCYARAEVMAERLAQEGVTTEKVWVMGGILQPKPDLKWNWHVAPVIWVHEKDGSYDRRVLDPSLEDHAATVDEWLTKFWDPSKQGHYLNSVWPPPMASAPYNRTMVYYTPSEIYVPSETMIPDPEQQKQDRSEARQALAAYSMFGKQTEHPKHE